MASIIIFVNYYLCVYLLLFLWWCNNTSAKLFRGKKRHQGTYSQGIFFVQYQSHINMQDGTFYLTLFATYKLLCGWDGSLFLEQNIREVFSQQNSSIAHTHSAKLESHFEVPTGENPFKMQTNFWHRTTSAFASWFSCFPTWLKCSFQFKNWSQKIFCIFFKVTYRENK